MTKRDNFRVAEKFRAKNIKTGRLTLTSNENLGIFKKGKASLPISSVKVSYPNFSELMFLAKESQAAIPEEEIQRSLYSEPRGILPSRSSFDASIERELFQVLSDRRQLSVPYNEYVPQYPNSRIVSLEDLKDLIRGLDNMCSQSKEGNVFDHAATGNDFHGVRHANCGRKKTGDACFVTPGNEAAKGSTQHKEMLDMLLDSVEDFDQDVAWEDLAELVEPDTDIYDLQAAGRTDFTYDMEAIASSYPYDVPHILEDEFWGPAIIGNGEHSVVSSTMQRQYDENMIPIGYRFWNSRDMEKGPTVKTSALGISPALDDRQFQLSHGPKQTLTTTHIPVHAAVQNRRMNTTSHRPFWRCNKLY